MYGLVKNLLNGRFVEASGGGVLDVIDPASDGNVVGQVPALEPADLVAVFDAAALGAVAWRAAGALARGRVLLTAAQLLRERAADLADVIVAEMGKTTAEATGEVGKAAEFFEYFGVLTRLPYGELLPDARPDTYAMQVREPLGVVVLVTPWNDPLLTPARKLAPALAAGNAVVIKPASEAPLITLRLAEILNEAGLPDGVLGTVTGRGSSIGEAITADPRIRAVSFTGSTVVGLGLQRRLAGRNVRVQTEMGGKNAAVVLDDADLDLAIPTIVAAAFGQAGQRCTATSRLIVQRGIAERVRSRVAEAVMALKVGPGSSRGVDLGPVVSLSARDEIAGRIDAARAQGADLLAATVLAPQQQAVGAFVAPTFLAVDPGNAIWQEEVFGPVLAMTVVDTLDDAINRVNDSSYGLSSAIFTTSLESSQTFIDGVDTGQVSVNLPTSGWDVHEPFGGFKDSGSPFKEQGLEALRFYTRVKTAAVRTR